MEHAHDQPTLAACTSWPWIAVLATLGVLYAVAWSRQPPGKPWNPWRAAAWYGGLAIAGIALIGPVAESAHTDFRAHMLGHLLIGMLAPILLVLGTPITLALRVLPVHLAKRVVGILSSLPLRTISHPITASILNMGGLVVLYRTDLYRLMHEHLALHVVVHLHILAAGYLFTAAMIGTDPMPHRPSYRFRMVVLILALGTHAVLAKSLYVAPPPGVPVDQAQAGSQLMYYGGDIVDLGLIIIFCWQWFRATAPRPAAVPPAISTRTP